MLGVYRQPDANTVEVVDRVKAMLPSFESQLPRGATLERAQRPLDLDPRRRHDVQFTLALTIALVIMVIFLFLRRVSATIIPALAVPISLIATLGAMYLFDFSIDNISLLGLTLAVGLVVDDAIVMLENIHRHMEEDGLGAFEAALKGSREIGFTIISISISLVAVFIPVLLMGGVIGRIFNEFAVVVTVAILASAFVSLTLTPMLAAKILPQPEQPNEQNGWSAYFERGFDAVLRGYDRTLQISLRHKPWMLALFFAHARRHRLAARRDAQGPLPAGGHRPALGLDRGAPGHLVRGHGRAAAAGRRRLPAVAPCRQRGVDRRCGNALNNGRLFVELKPRSERPALQKVLSDLRRDTARIAGIRTVAVPVQNLRIGGRSSRAEYQFVRAGPQPAAALRMVAEDGRRHEPRSAASPTSTAICRSTPRRRRWSSTRTRPARSASRPRSCARRSIPASAAGRFRPSIGTGDSFSVIMEFNDKANWTTAELPDVRIRNDEGKLVPIGAFARIERTAGSLTINQLGQLPAVTISFNLPPACRARRSVARIDRAEGEQNVPDDVTTDFAGTAKTFQDSVANQGILLIAAVLTIYIVLGILYESFIHPFTILTGLPSAVIGALLALRLFGMDLCLIAIIGLLMLIGIVKKNAIMMIDVALTTQREGKPPAEAIYEAALLRFRPIMMTTLAALMGVLPIALGIGAGAELRQPLGVALVGGLLSRRC